ncbi:MAG: primosomal protein N' [Peptococcaceae bacterium]|jgi:primosomal protein N' (replication factor Y)|nr:primosomal protein N' [Peptococcaceae bacterium]MDH7524294.1 primosomal protein N' [Peptococcaceae bacterium]
MFADVLILQPKSGQDQVLTYHVPEHTAGVEGGRLVVVPLKQHKKRGLVLRVFDERPAVRANIKPVESVLDEWMSLTSTGLEIAIWLSEYYVCSLNKAVSLFLPPAMRQKEKEIEVFVAGSREPFEHLLLGKMEEDILSLLKEEGAATRERISRCFGPDVKQSLEFLSKNRLIELQRKIIPPKTEKKTGRNGLPAERMDSRRPEVLNCEQQLVFDKIYSSIIKRETKKWLLFGVAGSGKTEIYLRVMEEILKLGRQVLYLVPEIALTPQVASLLLGSFGEKVAVLHSGMSGGERFDEWLRIRKGEARIVLGPRSAVFSPFTDLGLIIIDEEHENTYKQNEPDPRYDARKVALELADRFRALLVMGSATPSLLSFKLALQGNYELLRLQTRAASRPLPEVTIIDMKKDRREGNGGIFSSYLQEALKKVVAQGEQAILFMNRRGFHTFLLCRECGKTMNCPRCSISLTYHRSGNSILCHYCGYKRAVPVRCPLCGSHFLNYYGTGTERVAQELERFLPGIRYARMDADTTKTKGSHTRILKEFQQKKSQVLIGTQMVAKGLDFPGVTLVGIINADALLNIPDYQGAERAYQLMAQVAGRAGRGKIKGEVIIQAYSTENYVYPAVARHDYEAFFKKEIEDRRVLKYPPFYHLVRILVSGTEEKKVMERVDYLSKMLKIKIGTNVEVDTEIIGPAPAPLYLLKGRCRHHLLLKGKRLERLQELAAAVRETTKKLSLEPRVIIDVEPQNLL